MAPDWLVAILPANQMPGLKILVNFMDYNMESNEIPTPLPFTPKTSKFVRKGPSRISPGQHEINT